MVLPCWIADTRRVVNDLPSRTPVDHVDQRHRRVARPDEVGVQGVHRPVRRHRTPGRDQRLARHLPAEHPLHPHIRADAAEDVFLDLLQVEELEEPVQRLTHDGPLAGDP